MACVQPNGGHNEMNGMILTLSVKTSRGEGEGGEGADGYERACLYCPNSCQSDQDWNCFTGNIWSLRHYLRTQSLGHHTIDRLEEERGEERGSGQRSSLRGREKRPSSMRPTLELFERQHWGNSRETGFMERIWAFPERIDIYILS